VARAFKESGLLGRAGTAALSVVGVALVVVVEVGTAAGSMLASRLAKWDHVCIPDVVAPPLVSHGFGGDTIVVVYVESTALTALLRPAHAGRLSSPSLAQRMLLWLCFCFSNLVVSHSERRYGVGVVDALLLLTAVVGG